MNKQDWYIISVIKDLDTPALVVYPERVKQNIDKLISMIDDVSRLRPHVKTYKNKEVTNLMLQAGIFKFKCATIAEAEMLAYCNVTDVLLAYQPGGPKLDRFLMLILSYPNTKFSCIVDNIDSASEISAIAIKNNLQVTVYIDLNVGQNRTGITPSNALQLYKYCFELPGIKPVGLHAYDGHIHESNLETRTKLCNEAFEMVGKLQFALKQEGYTNPIIIAGGSQTFSVHAKRKEIECSPGTFIYWDMGYKQAFKEQAFLTSALIITRVISLPSKNLICLDAGHKSVASENALDKRIYFINAPELIMVSQSEEHLVADAGKGHNYKVGDVLYGIPYHICPTVALYERAVTIEENLVSGEWLNIARDRKINI